MATDLNIDDVTYEIRLDTSTVAEGKKKYFIRAGFPLSYLTDDMTYRDVIKVAKSLRQLGYTVVDRTKG